MTKQYFQCRLQKGTQETTAWIEKRGAKTGATIQLLPTGEMWKVINVYGHPIPEDMLKEHQKLNRGSLPSIKRIDQ